MIYKIYISTQKIYKASKSKQDLKTTMTVQNKQSVYYNQLIMLISETQLKSYEPLGFQNNSEVHEMYLKHGMDPWMQKQGFMY